MKILLGTTMVLGAVIMLGTNTPTEATTSQVIVHQTTPSAVTHVHWYPDGYYYDGYNPRYYYNDRPLFKFGPLQIL